MSNLRNTKDWNTHQDFIPKKYIPVALWYDFIPNIDNLVEDINLK